jgi:hypothetical protein
MRESSSNFLPSNSQKLNKIQGGDKKVMKKSLSLILSLAMVFTMFASVALADTAATTTATPSVTATTYTPQEKFDQLVAKGIFAGDPVKGANLDGLTTRAEFSVIIAKLWQLKDDSSSSAVYSDLTGYGWASGYIGAATKAGLLVGMGNGKFSPAGNVTLEQLAVVVATGLKLDLTATYGGTDKVSSWAKKYVAAAQKAGLPLSGDLTKAAKRSDLIAVSFAAAPVIAAMLTPTPTATPAPTATPVPAKGAVSSVSATNLREVNVAFNIAVDKASAENVAAYSIGGANAPAIDSVALQADGKSVILTLRTSLTNQATDNTLTVSGVKAKDTAVTDTISYNAFAFKVTDSALPTIVSVDSLGTKAVKVNFSEPVYLPLSGVAGAFKIDGVVVSGNATTSGHTMTIQLYTPLAVATHTLDVNGNVTDYAGYALIAVTNSFTVVADTVAPIVASVSNVTLESATVTFSEDVVPSQALTASNYYWMNGSTVNSSDVNSVKQIDTKTYKVSFTGSNRLPGYTTNLYVANIQDFSGNTIVTGSGTPITAALDQTRPSILSQSYDATAHTITLTFDKSIVKTSFLPANFYLQDSAGATYVIGSSVAYGASNNVLIISLATAPAAGTYTYNLSGIIDTTLLSNVMLPYKNTLTQGDTTAPTVVGVNGTNQTYIVTYSKAMNTTDTYSVLNPLNYYITYLATATAIATTTGGLPAGTNLSPTSDLKSVIISLPAGAHALTSLTVQGVKDTQGNFLAGFVSANNSVSNTFTILRAKATSATTLKVKFTQPVSSVNPADFTITSAALTSTGVLTATVNSADQTVVDLTTTGADLSPSNGSVTSYVVTKSLTSSTTSITGAPLTAPGAAIVYADGIKPTVLKDANGKIAPSIDGTTGISYDLAAKKITITFNEPIKGTNTTLFAQNFKAYKSDGTTLTYGVDYSVAAIPGGLTAVYQFNTSSALNAYTGGIEVALDNTNGNIVDVNNSTYKDLDGSTVLSNTANTYNTFSDEVTGASTNSAYTFLTSGVTTSAVTVATNGVTAVSAVAPASVTVGGLSFASASNAALNGYSFKLGTVTDGTPTSATVSGTVITINGDFTDAIGTTVLATSGDVQTAITGLTLPAGAAVTVTGTAAATATGASSAVITGGVTAVTGIAQVANATVTAAVKTNTISVTLGATTVTVSVTAGNSATAVASAIATALSAHPLYTVTSSGAVLTFTKTLTGVAAAPTFTIVN